MISDEKQDKTALDGLLVEKRERDKIILENLEELLISCATGHVINKCITGNSKSKYLRLYAKFFRIKHEIQSDGFLTVRWVVKMSPLVTFYINDTTPNLQFQPRDL